MFNGLWNNKEEDSVDIAGNSATQESDELQENLDLGHALFRRAWSSSEEKEEAKKKKGF